MSVWQLLFEHQLHDRFDARNTHTPQLQSWAISSSVLVVSIEWSKKHALNSEKRKQPFL